MLTYSACSRLSPLSPPFPEMAGAGVFRAFCSRYSVTGFLGLAKSVPALAVSTLQNVMLYPVLLVLEDYTYSAESFNFRFPGISEGNKG